MDPSVELSSARKSEILKALQDERELRKRLAQLGEDYKIDWDSLRTSSASQRRPEASREVSRSMKPKSQNSSPCFSPRLSVKSSSSVMAKSQVLSRETVAATSRPRISLKTREMDVERIQREVEKQWTFQPNIGRQRHSSGQIDPADVLSSEFEEKWERLSEPRTKAIQDREKAKKALEEEAVRQCSFHPSISQYPLLREDRVDDRLFHEAILRAKARQRLQAMNEESVTADCTFQPRTHSSSLQKPRTPIHQRLTAITRQREEEMARLREQIASAESSVKTYHPTINANSALLAERHCLKQSVSGKGVVERMEAEILKSEWRKFLLVKEQDRDARKQCPFSPRLSSFKAHSEGGTERLRRVVEDEEVYSFHPLIDSNSKKIAERKASEAGDSWARRIANRDIDKHAATQHRAALAFRASYTFTPQSSVTSPCMRSVPARYLLSKTTQSEEKLKPSSHPFSPSLVNSPRSSVKSDYAASENVSENIAKKLRERESRLKEFRLKREIEEAGKCSFFPATTHSTPRNSKSPPVRGLESFYSNVERANRLRAEKKCREDEVFKLSPRMPSHYLTKPKAFDLHGSSGNTHLFCLRASVLRDDLLKGRKLAV